VAQTYASVVKAGVHRASSIKVAEAAKVIENTQRDLNIALMNELALIFHRLGIDTKSVLEAAGTKWNFLKFSPGLVGGHCIGVDPYYLTTKAESVGYHPQVILAGRRINNGMGKFVAEQTMKLLSQLSRPANELKVAVLGLTFKENVPDLRNSKVPDIIHELREYGVDVVVHDPIAESEEAVAEYGIHLTEWDKIQNIDGLILAVAHRAYAKMGVAELLRPLRNQKKGVVMDVKSMLDPASVPSHLKCWRL
jgi:UDP-N-acetyl-D-galactosamine dehydrogenase